MIIKGHVMATIALIDAFDKWYKDDLPFTQENLVYAAFKAGFMARPELEAALRVIVERVEPLGEDADPVALAQIAEDALEGKVTW